jgi:hypothetical protein
MIFRNTDRVMLHFMLHLMLQQKLQHKPVLLHLCCAA